MVERGEHTPDQVGERLAAVSGQHLHPESLADLVGTAAEHVP